ncbi:MAG TPA: phage protease [Candidatus Binataceae bacterium]|nr:phage protease [Candidatus Binataceae bacterium]
MNRSALAAPAGASADLEVRAQALGSLRTPPAMRAASDAAGAGDAEVPDWIELLPAGVFHGRDGRGPFRLDDPETVIAATLALRLEAGIPVDYDHATDFAAPAGRPAPAAGWITELQARGGAIWGRVEWTARAAAAIRVHEYRYVSPVFQFDPASGKVTRLLRAGLTNNPNLYLTAIAAADTSAANHEGEMMEEFLGKLRDLLGLAADASNDEILAGVRELAEKAAGADRDEAAHAHVADPARYVGIAEFQKALTELNALKADRARERAAHAVDDAIRAGKLVPAQREWATTYCSADPRGFQAFVAKQPSILGSEPAFAGEPPSRIAAAASQLNTTEVAICAQLGVSHGDFLKRKMGRADFLRFERTTTEHDR